MLLTPIILLASLACSSSPAARSLDVGQSRKVLISEARTEHFEVHYRPGSRAGASVDRTCHMVESDYAEILRILDLAKRVDESEPFHLFLYDSVAELDEVTGTGGSAGFSAGREVHIPWDNDQTRRHELVHIIAAAVKEAGDEPRNMFFAEGIANATLRFVHGIPVHSVAAYELQRGSLPGLKEMLEHPDFYRFLRDNAGLNGYDVAGSFFLYLLEKHSAKRVMDFVKGKPLKKALGASVEKVEKGWHAHLGAFEIRPELLTLLKKRRGDGGEFTHKLTPEQRLGAELLGEPEEWKSLLEELATVDEVGKWKLDAKSAAVHNESGGDWSIVEAPKKKLGDCVLRAKIEVGEGGCWGAKLRYGLTCRAMLLGQGAFIYGPGGALASTDEVKLPSSGSVDLVLRVSEGKATFYVDGEKVLEAAVGKGPAEPGLGAVGGRVSFTYFSVRTL